MSTEKARWAKLAGLPKTTDKQQLDENFIGHQMVGNIFDREKEKYLIEKLQCKFYRYLEYEDRLIEIL